MLLVNDGATTKQPHESRLTMETSLVSAIIGGALIGVGASALMLASGKIAGLSGIVSGLLSPKPGDVSWRLALVAGIVVVGALLALVAPELYGFGVDRSLLAIVVAGLLVGFGARLGSGCTSGHGVCGLARLGPRSLVATLTFMSTGALAAFVANQLFGGSL
jgi:uncharacterized membrane protein YedE/YeeE